MYTYTITKAKKQNNKCAVLLKFTYENCMKVFFLNNPLQNANIYTIECTASRSAERAYHQYTRYTQNLLISIKQNKMRLVTKFVKRLIGKDFCVWSLRKEIYMCTVMEARITNSMN